MSAIRLPAAMTTLAGALVLALGLITCAGAADRPSSEQWAGVAQAISAQDASAEDKVAAITTSFPVWSEGFRALAQLQLRRKAYPEALASATRALSLDKTDSAAAACAVQALGALGRTGEAFALADQFSGAKDPQGLVNFHAAAAALAVKNRTKAELYLTVAFARVQDPPAEFTYLDARIAEVTGDDKRAALSLSRATAANSRFWDAWYELGAVQARLSEGAGDKAIEWLTKSEASFTKVAKAQEKDPQAWQGLGSTQLKLSNALRKDSPADSLSKAREAATSLDASLALKEDQRDAHLGLGQALLLTEEYERAIPHLERAVALGAQDRALTMNLMLAYQKTGKTAKFEEAARSLTAVSPSEKITMGMGLYHAGQLVNAAELLAAATGDLNRDSDRERLGAVYRILGHAHVDLAEQARSRLAASPEQKPALQPGIDKELDAARDAYREGGGLGDYPARHHFLASESQRSYAAAYEAGWQYLAWNSYASPAGWAVVVGNYGGAITGGNGLGGMWDHHPLHVAAWGLAAGIPLLIFITSLFGGRRETASEGAAEPKRRATVQAAPPPPPAKNRTSQSGPPPAKNRTPQPGPPPAKNRTPHPGPPPAKNRTPHPGPPAAKNRTPQPGAKAVTEIAARIKSETEPAMPAVTAVHMPTRTKEAASGDASALERRQVAKPASSQRRPPPARP